MCAEHLECAFPMPSTAQLLCKGSWRDRATALFSVLDTERQGSLTRGDMRMYFSSTFKVRQNTDDSIFFI